MLHEETILQTKLNPPRPPRSTLVRPRIDALLRDALDYRVTIVQASTGYGKSTALANLADGTTPLFWYSASEGDADPQQFLAHLIAAFRRGLPALPETPLALLQELGATPLAMDALLNALNDTLVEPALLVIDDYHLAASNDVSARLDHFLSFLPPSLHVIVSTRYVERPPWEHFVAWRARGQVLEIKRDALAFTRDEIAVLFRDKYAHELSPRDAALLEEKTEGWPIALQLVWQEIRANPKTDIAALLARGTGDHEGRPYLETLFAYLA
ncbi:MAG TPA: transcriptional regulator, partial [Anaerolineae bacterium]